MGRGMDWHGGYDCSGLVIASMCGVLGIGVEQWPWDCRHLVQLESLAVVGHRASAGDIVIMDGGEPEDPFSHIGIQALGQYIHASGRVRLVVEGRVERVNRTAVIPLAEFAAIPLAGSRLD